MHFLTNFCFQWYTAKYCIFTVNASKFLFWKLKFFDIFFPFCSILIFFWRWVVFCSIILKYLLQESPVTLLSVAKKQHWFILYRSHYTTFYVQKSKLSAEKNSCFLYTWIKSENHLLLSQKPFKISKNFHRFELSMFPGIARQIIKPKTWKKFTFKQTENILKVCVLTDKK